MDTGNNVLNAMIYDNYTSAKGHPVYDLYAQEQEYEKNPLFAGIINDIKEMNKTTKEESETIIQAAEGTDPSAYDLTTQCFA